MEHKFLALEELKAPDDATRSIEGFASIFNNVDDGNDIVLPGAFAKSLKKRLPAMLWQHDRREPVGAWDDASENEKGLLMRGSILDTARGLDAYKLVKAKVVKGLSIGYNTKKYEIDQTKGHRKLIELDLHEVSIVTFPMNEKAVITRVKSEDGTFSTEREFEDILRDVGLSQREAKTVISHGYKALISQRDVGSEELTNLFNQFTYP